MTPDQGPCTAASEAKIEEKNNEKCPEQVDVAPREGGTSELTPDPPPGMVLHLLGGVRPPPPMLLHVSIN